MKFSVGRLEWRDRRKGLRMRCEPRLNDSFSISWIDKITNKEVMSRVGEKRIMLETIARRKKYLRGHAMRGDGLMIEVKEGKRMICMRRNGMET